MIELIRSRRAFMDRLKLLKPRRKLTPQIPPTGIEREYLRYALDFQIHARALTRTRLISVLPQLSDQRVDAVDTIRAKRIIDDLRTASAGNEIGIQDSMRNFARRTADYQGSQLQKQIRQSLGIELPFRDQRLNEKTRGFVTENVSLIRSLPTETFNQVEKIVLAGLNDGRRWESIADDIENRFEVSESRAALIARDQVGKFYGSVNNIRQTELGVTSYVWRTSRDERVRPEHQPRDGKSFSWFDAPDDGHPGQPFGCRCTAEPDLSEILNSI